MTARRSAFRAFSAASPTSSVPRAGAPGVRPMGSAIGPSGVAGRIVTLSAALFVAVAAVPVSAQDVSRPVVQPVPPPEARDLGNALSRLARNPQDLDALLAAGEAALAVRDEDAALGFYRRASGCRAQRSARPLRPRRGAGSHRRPRRRARAVRARGSGWRAARRDRRRARAGFRAGRRSAARHRSLQPGLAGERQCGNAARACARPGAERRPGGVRGNVAPASRRARRPLASHAGVRAGDPRRGGRSVDGYRGDDVGRGSRALRPGFSRSCLG